MFWGVTFLEVLDRCQFESSGCVSWNGARDGRGYPHYGFQGGTYRVFRTLYEMLVGPLLSGQELHHVCGNKACVNPHHVESRSRAEHMAADGRMFHRDALGRFRGLPCGGA